MAAAAEEGDDKQANKANNATKTSEGSDDDGRETRSVYYKGFPLSNSITNVQNLLLPALGPELADQCRIRMMDIPNRRDGTRQGYLDFRALDSATAALKRLSNANITMDGCAILFEMAIPARNPQGLKKNVIAKPIAAGEKPADIKPVVAARNSTRRTARSLVAAASAPEETKTRLEKVEKSESRKAPAFTTPESSKAVDTTPFISSLIFVGDVPANTTIEEMHTLFLPFGEISAISMKSINLDSGEMTGPFLIAAPVDCDTLKAVFEFEDANSAAEAAQASETELFNEFKIVQSPPEGKTVRVGPFVSATTNLGQLARIMTQFGVLVSAKMLKPKTGCLITFRNETDARKVLLSPLSLKGVVLSAVLRKKKI